jgi:hypothetical protein
MEKKLHRRRSSLGYHSSENRRFLRWQMYRVLSLVVHTQSWRGRRSSVIVPCFRTLAARAGRRQQSQKQRH